jgi:hypothetical protein
MHQALHITEVISNIASSLSPSDLVAVLSTCKWFEEPARAERWRRVPHLGVLARLLPLEVRVKPSHSIMNNNTGTNVEDEYEDSTVSRFFTGFSWPIS